MARAAVWWVVPRVDRATTVLRVTLDAAFPDGTARLLAAASGLTRSFAASSVSRWRCCGSRK
ncbi:hypothetical protein AB0M44_25440 [Streptosporangium subroseum]|uniref:hypothetical protein n=1 Tax=Streptosporangium subroseum TaxID=106412 RepID=UPI00343E45CA